MKISLLNLMMITALMVLLFTITFSMPPLLGSILWIWLCIAVFPPFVIVSAIYSHGARRAFFIGCISAGLVHFVGNTFLAAIMTEGFSETIDLNYLIDGGWGPHFDHRIMQLTLTVFSFLGGLVGIQAYRMALPKNPAD